MISPALAWTGAIARGGPLSPAALGCAFAGLVLAYGACLTLASNQPLAFNLWVALNNVAALYLAGAGAITLLGRLPARWRLAAHLPLAIGFSCAWYFLVLAGFTLTGDWVRGGLAVNAFRQTARVWQLFQGVTVYAVVALAWHLHLALRATEAPLAAPEPPRDDALLLRDGKEFVAVGYDEIVRISGAGDYAEVATRTRRYLSDRALHAFAAMLPDGFVRAHRSHIVRIAAIVRAEPAGNGRLSLHLADGETVVTSREGARALRARSR
jgi:two-component system, LytTR family, response regulator